MASIRRYAEETAFCIGLNSPVRDRIKLIVNTLRFHINNFFHIGIAVQPETKNSYRINQQDLQLRTIGGDIYIFYEMFLDQVYQKPLKFCNDVKVIIDAGANIGCATLYFAETFKNADFICIEPDPQNFQILKQNTSELENKVELVQKALSNFSGESSFSSEAEAWGYHLSDNADSSSLVETTDMADLIEEYQIDQIDILKMDIEGHEKNVLSGNPEWLNIVNLLIIELHNDYSIDEFRNDIKNSGLVAYKSSARTGSTEYFAYRSK